MKKGKCIVLFSGGLDSILAAKILLNQDLVCIGFNGVLPFIPPDDNLHDSRVQQLADDIGLPLHFYRCDSEYLEMVKNPPHGYGKNMNPCVDCKIHFLVKAAELMNEINADFVATGEVIGQRPMSQLKNTMNRIEKISGLRGRLLRPLSARLLPETIPEKEGIVDRELLYDISGRSRKRQMELARKFTITDYSSPAGGCLFTDPFISRRIKDLLDYHSVIKPVDFYLLTVGRHFRLTESAKVIIAKNEEENSILIKYKNHGDLLILPGFKGPSALAFGTLTDLNIQTVYSLVARYGKPDSTGLVVNRKEKEFTVSPQYHDITSDVLERMRI